jgi:hypothetical protein
MMPQRSLAQEAAEDIFFGQVVIIFARWFVILGGLIVVLWSATTVQELTSTISFVVALMAMNFFVHGRYLLEKPANRSVLLGLSFLDLAIVTGIIAAWRGAVGLASPFFVFYYPVLAAFAFVFPPRLSFAFSVVAMTAYATVVFRTDPALATRPVDIEEFAVRLITMSATAALATYYWRVQRDRRRGVAGAPS